MKKLLIPAFVMFAFAGSAQSKLPSNNTSFGIRGALNISNISNSVNSTAKSLTGFAGGVFVDAPIGTEFAIQPELDYSLKGFKVGNVKSNLSYIALPVLFKWTPSAVKGFNILLGPEADYLISAKVKGAGKTVDDKFLYKKFDAGINIGVGYDFLPSLGVDVRYGLGLLNLNNIASGRSVKNRTIQIGLRYLFGR